MNHSINSSKFPLPPELLSETLLHIPINSNLTALALASKQQLAPFLLYSLAFARRHFRHQFYLSQKPCVYEYILSLPLFQGWSHLPFTYQTILFKQIMKTHIPCTISTPTRNNNSTSDNELNTVSLLLCNKVTEQTALKMIHTLIHNTEASRFDPSKQQDRLLRWATLQNYPTCVKYLLETCTHSIDPSAKQNEPIRVACKNGFSQIVDMLLNDPRTDPSCQSQTCLKSALKNGFWDVVRELLSHGDVDPTVNGQAAIRGACEFGLVEVVEVLLRHQEVDPGVLNDFPVRIASERGFEGVVRLLVGHESVDPGCNGNFPIRIAAANGHLEVVRVLLGSKNVDPTADNQLAIKSAAANGHLEVVKLLLRDHRVDFKDGNHFALAMARKHERWDVVDCLMSLAASVPKYTHFITIE
ncbi:ankyrin repeat-containing domain protein [Obelidium mucronatum]|nr:ankyrin repeat-containing domain protein [Obelidium mucronatum]